jgi:very-short-patch-repair endonuclease
MPHGYVHSNKSLKTKRRMLRSNATPQERILWSHLRGNNLGYRFQRQHSIGNYSVDFYCSNKMIIIELDGVQHDDQVDKLYDIERTKYFESLGYKVNRFWNNEINTNIDGVLMEIQELLNKS